MVCQRIEKGAKKVFYRGGKTLKGDIVVIKKKEEGTIMFTNCKLLLQNVYKRTPRLKGVLLCNYKRNIIEIP